MIEIYYEQLNFEKLEESEAYAVHYQFIIFRFSHSYKKKPFLACQFNGRLWRPVGLVDG